MTFDISYLHGSPRDAYGVAMPRIAKARMTLDYHPLAKYMVELLRSYIVLPNYRELNPEALALFIRQIQLDRSVFSKLKSAPPKRAAS